MPLLLTAALGMLLGWLIWNFAGEGGFRLEMYLLVGVAGTLCGVMFMGYLGKPFEGTLGMVTVAPASAFFLVSMVAYLDRRKLH